MGYPCSKFGDCIVSAVLVVSSGQTEECLVLRPAAVLTKRELA